MVSLKATLENLHGPLIVIAGGKVT
jgi:hypothetical protein